MAASGWTRHDLAGFTLAAGTATVTVRAARGNGHLFADGLALVKTCAVVQPFPGRGE
jgi:hypothetical protein